MRRNLLKFGMLCLMTLVTLVANAQDVTATWDFQTMEQGAVNIQNATGTVKSNVDGIVLTVDATNNGKLWSRGGDAQFNAGTIIQVPVKSTSDQVSVTSYPGYFKYTVGGAAADANTYSVKAKSADVKQGYVAIVATAEAYLYSITVVQAGQLSEKPLYKQDFASWKAIGDYSAGTYSTTTKYSKEKLTITTKGTNVYPTSDDKKIGITGYLMAGKYDGETKVPAEIVTSALANISKVDFTQYATGSNRGWKVWAKGEGDADWVLVSETPVSGSKTFTNTTAQVNRNNVQLKFTNLAEKQNAYMSDLVIYGKVDLSKNPALNTFTANGEEYVAADVFEEDADGNYVTTVEVSKKATMISKSNPIKATATAGTIGTITYTDVKSTANGTKTETKVSFPMTLGDAKINYIINFVWKPDYTVNYYDVDNTTIVATQKVEKDAAIATLNNGSKVTVANGSKFRGWLLSTAKDQKADAKTVISKNPTSLYALVTDIEGDDKNDRYVYNFKSQYFYPEDHDALNIGTGAYYHGGQHGWAQSGSFSVKVTGNATIIYEACKFNNGDITVKDAAGKTVATIAKSDKDGEQTVIKYTGKATTLTFSFTGSAYSHYMTVINTGDGEIAKNAQGYYVATPGDGNSLLSIFDMIKLNEDGSSRVKIFLPNGTYDLGKLVETDFPTNNISLIGQNIDKTIIVTTPDKSIEGLGTADMFFNTKSNIYVQDLTLKNALDYYGSGAAGRAAVWQDKGNRTIFKNVKMLSYQDTYYSQNNAQQSYFENSDIHGTVDFICGGGDVRFQDCTISLEPRSTNGTGGRTITAPTTTTKFGYVFDNCKIVDLANGKGDWNYGRTWQNNPVTVFLNTTLDDNAAKSIISTRWNPQGMNGTKVKVFGEYNTKNAAGSVISPTSSKLTCNGATTETILTEAQAKEYSYAKMFTNWDPYTLAKSLAPATVKATTGKITWNAVSGATAYAIFNNGTFVAIVDGKTTSYTVSGDASKYTVRSANEMGGFGYETIKDYTDGIDATEAVNSKVVAVEFFTAGGAKTAILSKGVNLVKKTYADGSQVTSKVIVK